MVGFHGQTVLHRPQDRLTVQIGDGAALAKRLGIPVVHDFRAADVAAGGQGAPLVPVFHRAIVDTIERPHPVAVLNIGGVANVTFVDGGPDPIACDTGPGNALIDDFMRARTGAPYDDNGDAAAGGKPDEAFIARVLEHPFFDAEAAEVARPQRLCASPTSACRNSRSSDGAATLSALTVAAVARIVPHLPQPPRAWIVAGGGARNRTLMRMLAERLAPATVETADQAGWSADALEAQAFAFLAVRCLRGLPITFPTTTGAPKPLPAAWWRSRDSVDADAIRRSAEGLRRAGLGQQLRLQLRAVDLAAGETGDCCTGTSRIAQSMPRARSIDSSFSALASAQSTMPTAICGRPAASPITAARRRPHPHSSAAMLAPRERANCARRSACEVGRIRGAADHVKLAVLGHPAEVAEIDAACRSALGEPARIGAAADQSGLPGRAWLAVAIDDRRPRSPGSGRPA